MKTKTNEPTEKKPAASTTWMLQNRLSSENTKLGFIHIWLDLLILCQLQLKFRQMEVDDKPGLNLMPRRKIHISWHWSPKTQIITALNSICPSTQHFELYVRMHEPAYVITHSHSASGLQNALKIQCSFHCDLETNAIRIRMVVFVWQTLAFHSRSSLTFFLSLSLFWRCGLSKYKGIYCSRNVCISSCVRFVHISSNHAIMLRASWEF